MYVQYDMEILDFLTIMIPVLIAGVLIARWISLADARARIELQKRLQKSKEMTSANQRRENGRMQPAPIQQDQEDAVGTWVPQLLESFGIDPEVIFEDEMPPDIKAFLPLAKGYVQAQGGLGGIMQSMMKGQQPPGGGGQGPAI